MKTLKFFAAALAIVAAASCAKEPNANDGTLNDEVQKVHMVFSASVDPETKTTLNDHTVEWTVSDKIVIYGSDPYRGITGMTYEDLQGTFSVVSGSLSDDKTFADFEGDIVPSDKYFALYPASGWSSTITNYKYQFSGLANQNAVKGSFDPSKHVMVANTLEDGHFKFRNVCALAKVTVAADEIYSILVTGTASYGAIGGPFAWNAKDFTFIEVGGSSLHSITLSNSDGSALENGATYYIVLPLHTISGFTVSICDKSGVVVGSKSKASDFTVERNKIYDLGSIEAAPKKYTITKQISQATELVSGNKYVIQSYGSQSKFWTNVDNKLVLTGSLSTSSQFSVEHLFEYTKEGIAGITASDSYNHKSCGYWKSVANDKYVGSDFAIKADRSTALVVVSANGWDGESGKDIDMYKNASDQTLCVDSGYSNFKLATIANSGGNSYRKWYIYEVQEVK